MTETIILIVLCAAILVLLILGFVYFSFLKKKEQNGNANQDTEMIKMEFQSIREQLPHIVGEKVKDEFLNIQNAFHKQENTLKDDFQKIRDQIGETQRVNEKSIRESTDAMRKEMESKLNAITEKVNASLTDGFKENAESMSAIRERLGKIDEAQKHLDALQKDVISLNTVLKGNQSRGRYGEMQLEMLLEKIFPDGRRKGLFETQTKLPDVKDENLKPDAAVIFHSGETVVRLCIDSKFPYEDYETLLNLSDKKEDTTVASLSFKNAVKEKAKQVTKYVGVPGTADYAILFIPSEGIYATIQQEYGDLIAEFSKKGVIFASPTILDDGYLRYIDYDLDVKLYPDGMIRELDQKEYRVHAKRFAYPDWVQRKCQKAEEEIEHMMKEGIAPFNEELCNRIFAEFVRITSL